tara:strand:- start:18 stop:197 length:180 start_codon:yes stop_codon:yes gene_type:complete
MDLRVCVEEAVWQLLINEAMYTDIDLEDEETAKTIAKALNNIAEHLLNGESNEPCNSNS